MKYKAYLYHGQSLEVLQTFPNDYFHSIITDPPYELGFMGKSWDSAGIAYSVELWQEVLRVLKPGGYLLSFGGTRTQHRMVCAVEDAGFIIQDQIVNWLYGSGFPKSMDISKAIDKAAGVERKTGPVDPSRAGRLVNQQGNYETKAGWSAGNRKTTIDPPATVAAKQWDGWGTALKPAHEPICVAKKPISEKTIAKNVLKHGVGGINIDGCRIETKDSLNGGAYSGGKRIPVTGETRSTKAAGMYGEDGRLSKESFVQPQGRFPANVIMDEGAGAMLDEQSGMLKSGDGNTRRKPHQTNAMAGTLGQLDREEVSYGDTGGASRFFYCAKASKSERGEGNDHPTVKPIALMRYLIKLVTPPGGIVLDPFCGSGSTILAAGIDDFVCAGIDCSAHFIEIACKRWTDKFSADSMKVRVAK